jgi:hypothetical protein
MDERLRQLELRRLARRRRFRLISLVLLILIGGTATNAYLAFRPAHVRDVVQRSLRQYFGEDVRFASGIDVELPEGIQVHHLRLESGADRIESADGSGVRLTSNTLEIRRLRLVPRLRDLLIGRLVVGHAIIDSPVLSVGCVGAPCDDIGALLRRLTRSVVDSCGGPRELPRLEIRGGEVLFEAEKPGGERARYRLFNIDGHVTRLASGEVRLDLSAQSPYLESLDVRARRSPDDGSLVLEFELDRVDLAALAPEILRPAMQGVLADDAVEGMEIQGAVDLVGEIRLTDDADSNVELRHLSGNFVGSHLRLPSLALPLEDLEGTFAFANSRLALEGVTGRLGAGGMRARGVLHFTPDLAAVETVEGTLSAEAIPAETRLFPAMRPALREHLDRLRLTGTFGLDIALAKTNFPLGPESVEDVRVEISLNSISVLHRSFPLAFERVVGGLVVENGRVIISRPITGVHSQGEISVEGRASLDASGDADIVVSLENVLLGERLRNALPAESVYIWDELRPSGNADLRFALKREAGSEDFSSLVVNAVLRDVSCVAQRFPCQFTGVTGRLNVDLLERRIALDDLEGKHNGEWSQVVGYFEYGAGGVFLVRISTPRMTLSPDVRTSLPGDLGRVAKEFGLRGTVGSVVTLDNRRSGALDASAEVTVDDLVVNYQHFPYPLRLRSGSIEIDREGGLIFRDLKTSDTDIPRVGLSGTLTTLGAARVFDYRVDVERLDLDEPFVTALPNDTRRFVNGLGLGGRFAGIFEGRFSYDVDRPSQSHSIYRANNIRTENASIDFGPQFNEIVAEGKFEGRRGLAEKHRFSGELQVESTSFNRLHIKNSHIQFSLGEDLPALVDLRHGITHDEGGFEPSAALLARLHGDQIEDSFQAHVRSSKLYDGDLEGFLYIDIGTRHDFGGEFSGHGVQVALASEDVFKVPGEGLSGAAEGKVSFSGNTGDLASMKGAGEGRIESAELGRLPGIFSIASWLSGRLTVKPRLREVMLKFSIEDLAFVCSQPEGVTIHGDGIHLNGGGTMDFDGNLALRLTPSVIERKIPLIGFVFDFLKKILLPVQIQGPLEDPNVSFTALGVPVGAGGGGRAQPAKADSGSGAKSDALEDSREDE